MQRTEPTVPWGDQFDPEEFLNASIGAMDEALRYAVSHLLQGEGVLAADSWHPDDLPVDERDRLLDLLANGAEFSEDELTRHLGSPPIAADRRTHIVLSEFLRKTFRDCYVVGEEATDNEWDHAQGAPLDSLIYQVDAIDGSLPYESLTFGFSINLLAYRRGEESDDLLLAALLNSTGLLAVYQKGIGVSVGTTKSRTRIADPLVDNFENDTVAVLGARPDHRRLIRAILDDPGLKVFTTAGAPAAMGIIAGRLGALVASKPQTTHDAAFLPILASLGVPILADGGLVLGIEDVRRLFGHVAREQDDRRAHPVPRFVVARNPITGATIAQSVFSAGG